MIKRIDPNKPLSPLKDVKPIILPQELVVDPTLCTPEVLKYLPQINKNSAIEKALSQAMKDLDKSFENDISVEDNLDFSLEDYEELAKTRRQTFLESISKDKDTVVQKFRTQPSKK